MKIELKNIKMNMAFSEETICFTADIYVDDVKSGYAKNAGHGGNTHIMPYDGPVAKEKIKAAEVYCKSLPDVDDLKMNLEFFVDLLIDKEIEKKEMKKVEKLFSKGIVYGIKGSNQYRIVSWKGHTIESILKLPNGKETLQNAINKVKAKLEPNETIWNTNI